MKPQTFWLTGFNFPYVYDIILKYLLKSLTIQKGHHLIAQNVPHQIYIFILYSPQVFKHLYIAHLYIF